MIRTNKTLSRLAAVQILFQLDFNEKMNIGLFMVISSNTFFIERKYTLVIEKNL